MLSGIALGIIILILLAVMMIKIGVKIPMRPFFLASSLLVFYLSFKFLGMGIHGLQLGGILSATHIKWMPSIEFIALYPTWQNLVPQLLFTVFAAAAVLWNRRNLAQPAYQQHH
ncbi:MAG: hypothetical protein A2189_00825 [Paenibacillus sp. RIFOXYA1_FULL_44_5]|nr:MAG: hypothetical protein A2189_00825 [Paenibacillus sp. RIFOXYA1_FULL_44_5]